MHDESRYPTLKYMRCKKCGHTFTASFTGDTDCPECVSFDTTTFEPFENPEDSKG